MKRNRTLWLDDDIVEEAAMVAQHLGYSSFSHFVEDLLVEAVNAFNAFKHIYNSKSVLRKKVRENIITKIVEKMKLKSFL